MITKLRMLLAGFAALVLLIMGCDRRGLEVIIDEKVRVHIVVNWKVNFVYSYIIVPNGMTVMIWNMAGGAPLVRTSNENSVSVRLDPGTYRMMIFNEMADEYSPYVKFHDAGDYDLMTQRGVSYPGDGWYAGLTYMYGPEDPRIAVALDTFEITADMVHRDTSMLVPYEHYKGNPELAYRESEFVYEIPEEPWPMTVDLYVSMRVNHRWSLKSIEGNISGMAEGFYLSKIIRTTESGTLRFNPEYWNRQSAENGGDSIGIISTRVATYGLPYGKELLEQRDSTDNIMRLHLTLANDSVADYTFNVGKYIKYIKPTGEEARVRYRQDLRDLKLELNLPDTIDLPPVDKKNATGFDAWVDEWDDGGTFDLGGF